MPVKQFLYTPQLVIRELTVLMRSCIVKDLQIDPSELTIEIKYDQGKRCYGVEFVVKGAHVDNWTTFEQERAKKVIATTWLEYVKPELENRLKGVFRHVGTSRQQSAKEKAT